MRLNGFNSILAVSSIPAAKMYYMEFKKQIKTHPEKALRIATIYSYAPNEDAEEMSNGILGEENSDSAEELDASSREFLDMAIDDYNKTFGTAYDTSSEKFPNYYKDLSLRMKNKEVDLLIVVNMFLTGFDATTLNTLWVDKNLKQHGLIQAFSRTNRILNAVKTYGNIVCFRNLQKETDEAIALFGDKDANGIVLLKPYKDYYYGYDENGKHQKGYEERIAELLQKYPLGSQMLGEKMEKEFITAFGSILRLRNILTSFDEFAGQEILSPIDFQDYTGIYNDLYQKWRKYRPAGESIDDDIVFEMELVKQIEVNIDYILMLIAQYHKTNCKDKEILVAVDRAIKSSWELRSKKELIEAFIATINSDSDIRRDWEPFVRKQRKEDMETLIADEHLKPDEAYKFIANAFREGEIRTDGTDIVKLMPPMSLFSGGREEKKQTIIEKLKAFFEKYAGLDISEKEEAQL